ncbi:hypothetical protein QJS83_09335 [Bdellovibrio sp. 22V]|uniref:hypothetical protein n=1 Tax=Bdellovibrio sp. 22V TaxID=3044166 RepID=UPI0025426E43|nr:hypothetical protein [Bdellovibrio sp. 22V]WII70660.1 hypothetical protein QJS83_09335 [Bdellovibrio sp. 22V]
MKLFIAIFALVLSAVTGHAASIQRLTCIPSFTDDTKIEIVFSRSIDPLKPFIGTYNWPAALKISHPGTTQGYTRQDVTITPEITYDDINLRGDAGGYVYLRLYPEIKNGVFVRYTGQLFINDLDVRAYYNFKSYNGVPGFICQ